MARLGWLLLGLLATALAALGALLPVLPTTPFLLVALAGFSRSSPRLRRRLLELRIFGPYLQQWERDRTVPRDAKRRAYVLVVVAFGVSIAVVDVAWLRILLAAVGVALVAFLARLPTTPPPGGARGEHGEDAPD